MMRKNMLVMLLVIVGVSLFAVTALFAASFDNVVKSWERRVDFDDDYGNETKIRATFVSAEYVEALVQSEAEKNLWTQDETDSYRYSLLKTLELADRIAIHLDINSLGSPLRMAPFGKYVKLWIKGKSYEPIDYDKRFNFKLSGQRDGYVYFPRFDPETGSPLLEGAKGVKMTMESFLVPAADGKKIDFVWNVNKDDPASLYKGKAMARLEQERLIRRLEKLNAEKQELQEKLEKVQQEIYEVEARVDELDKD